MSQIITRFPPEPSGYLHLGHAKAMFVSFNFAKKNSGLCYMRFDDTNPIKEKQEYIDSILEDLKWLCHEPYKITYTSDYFDQLYECAINMIKNDKAYVCELNSEDMQKQRYDSVESPYRNRPINDSLKLFNEMKEGKHAEGSITLRLKGDMKSNNTNMRDMVAYRILFREHPKTGNKYNIYPTYDFSHPIVDYLEKISHSFCSSEFQSRNELYNWIISSLYIKDLPNTKDHIPIQIEYCKLNVTHTVLSKRKLIQLVNNNIVSGWDDPRMSTIRGLRRRGYTANAINDFCQRIGTSIGTSCASVNYNLLEACLRYDLEDKAPRIMAVMNPLKVNIINVKNITEVFVLDFPTLGELSSKHKINVGNTVYIDKDDFRLVDSKDYFRLAPNKIVRLKYFGLIKCVNYKLDINNCVHELDVELLDKNYKPEKRVKGTINWVSDINKYDIEVRKYDHLFPQELDPNKDFIEQINTNSLTILNVMVDSSIKDAKINDKFQFERIGYINIDQDSTCDKIIANLSVFLKEDKNKNIS